MTNARHILGRYGEQAATDFIATLGYELLDRNWHHALGELDIVANGGRQVVFIEVKTRNGRGFGHPFEAITSTKILKMRQLVGEWCRAYRVTGVQVRLDAISVLLTGGKVHIEHLKQVF